jgi:putative tricarboxylic transport membrane protein
LLNAIFISLILSSLWLFVGGRYITREFARILKLPYPMLGTLITALCVVGAYCLRNSFYDVIIMFIFTFIGYFFEKFKYSTSAFILGLILGELAENSLRKQIIIGDGSWMGFVTRPISLIIILVAIVVFLLPAIGNLRKKWRV